MVVPPSQLSGCNVNKRSLPLLSVNQFQSSATNESGVFAGSASLGDIVHRLCALAAASIALLRGATAARLRRSLCSFERGIFPPLATDGLVRGSFFSACRVPVCDAIACLKIDCGFAHRSEWGVVAGLIGVILCLTA